MDKIWYAFFSQTGKEIADLAETLGRWPTAIITNKRPSHLRKITRKIPRHLLKYVGNNPTIKEYTDILGPPSEDKVVTLHGWLRIVPESLCNSYNIINGHPGLITQYPELKGKDPQERAYKGILNGTYECYGSVIHKVSPEVDEGSVIAHGQIKGMFKDPSLDSRDYKKFLSSLREISKVLWINTLKKHLNV